MSVKGHTYKIYKARAYNLACEASVRKGRRREFEHLPRRLGTTVYYYTLYSQSVFSLAKNLQLILEISATHRLVSYLIADN